MKRRSIRSVTGRCLCFAVAAGSLTFSAAGQAATEKLVLKETRLPNLGKIPAEIRPDSVWVNNTGTIAYYVLHKDGHDAMVVNGVTGRTYDKIEHVTMTPDQSSVVFVGSREGKQYVVVDGRESAGYDAVSSIGFNPVGLLYFVAGRSGEQYLVVDGQRGATFAEVKYVIWSSNGKHFAYIGKKDFGECVVADGKPEQNFHEVADLVFSKDGRHLAYTASSLGSVGVTSRVVLDGKLMRSNYSSSRQPQFDWDGRIAYAAKKGEKWVIVVDHRESAQFDSVGGLMFSGTGRHFAFIAMKNSPVSTFSVVKDGVEGPDYASVFWPQFSPDGLHLSYAAKKGNLSSLGWNRMVVDGVESAVFDAVFPTFPSFSADSKHYLCSAVKHGKHVVVIDNQSGPEFDEVLGEQFIGGSNEVIYQAWKFKQPPPEFSGFHRFLVVNGVQTPDYDYIWPIGRIANERVITFYILRGGMVFRVDTQLASQEGGGDELERSRDR